jgi:hypothetical protein
MAMAQLIPHLIFKHKFRIFLLHFKTAIILLGCFFLFGCEKPEQPEALTRIFGEYVGQAQVEKPETNEIRDLDVVVRPYKNIGFSIEWTTVSYVNNRMDPSAKRKSYEIHFIRIDKNRNLYKVEIDNNPFQEKQNQTQLRHPLIWAKLSDDAEFKLYSLYPLPDGGYNLQSYIRKFAKDQPDMVDLLFQVLENGDVKRRVVGTLRKIKK